MSIASDITKCYVILEERQETHPDGCDIDNDCLWECENCKRMACSNHHQGYYCVMCIDDPTLPQSKRPLDLSNFQFEGLRRYLGVEPDCHVCDDSPCSCVENLLELK